MSKSYRLKKMPEELDRAVARLNSAAIRNDKTKGEMEQLRREVSELKQKYNWEEPEER